MGKYFTTFNFYAKNEIDEYIRISIGKDFFNNDLKDLLSIGNVNFVLSGINRLQSMLLCELKLSYVQQSQRYVPVTNDFIKILDNTPEELAREGTKLINQSIHLYNKMTELKDPDKKGRLKEKDFVYGITYEDARSVLPLCMSTNLVVSMSADKLIDLFKLFNTYPYVFREIKKELMELLPGNILHKINSDVFSIVEKDYHDGDIYFENKMKNLTFENDVIMLECDNITKNIAIGALASQNTESPNDIYELWGEESDEKSKKLISNVLGYGHMAIAEQGRTTCAMRCSLAAYHQLIRHRLQNIRRESIRYITTDLTRGFIIPECIRNNKDFFNELVDLTTAYMDFYNKYNGTYDKEFIMQFMLNATPIKFIVSSNIRNDITIFKDRLCFTAQDEVRDLYFKKFRILHKQYPELVRYGLPPCVTENRCKEGKLNCGKVKTVQNLYDVYK